ncbi:mite allergen Der f 7-like [Sergentomyia squamirostris]
MVYRLVLVALLALSSQVVHSEKVVPDERNMRRANMNVYTDYVMTYIAPIFRESGLVPMALPDTSIGWEAQPIWITYGGIIDLHNGRLDDIETVRRADDCFLSYNRQLLRMEIASILTRMPFHYDYETRVMGLGIFRGWVEGHMENMVIRFDFLLDMFDFFLFMQDFRVTQIADMHVRVRGNVLTDWLANVIIDIVIFFFQNTITNLVSDTLQEFIQLTIDEVNTNRVRFADVASALKQSLETSDPTPMAQFSENIIRMYQKYVNV